MKIILDTVAETIQLADGTVHPLSDFTVKLEVQTVEEEDRGQVYVARKRGMFTFFTIRGSWLNEPNLNRT